MLVSWRFAASNNLEDLLLVTCLDIVLGCMKENTCIGLNRRTDKNTNEANMIDGT